MPWQRQVMDVAGEVEQTDDGRWRLAYREVRVSVPRQSGKTTLVVAPAVHRCIAGPALGWGERQRVKYLAQTGLAARDKLFNDQLPMLRRDRRIWSQIRKVTRSQGREGFEFVNGSLLEPAGPSRDATHGQVIDGGFIDEAFAHENADAEQGVRPAMVTRFSPQLWVFSTAGDARSEYWWGKVDDGRERCISGEHGSVCYFEWSALDAAMAHTPTAWPTFHPAIGHTQTVETLAAERDSMRADPDGFARAYGNVWTGQVAGLISDERWKTCTSSSAITGPIHIGIDVCPGDTPEGRSAAVVVAGHDPSGANCIEVAAHRPGAAWVIDYLLAVDETQDVASITVDSVGPVRMLLDEIRNTVGARRLNVLSTADACAGAQRLHESINQAKVRHRNQPSLNTAVAGAAKRPIGDSWVFGRRSSTADVSPLVAAAWAHHQLIAHPFV